MDCEDLYIDLLMYLSGPTLECVTLSTYFSEDKLDTGEFDNAMGVEQFVMVMAASCPNLASFCIESNTAYTHITKDHLLVKLLTHCKKLSVLKLPNCYCGTNAFLQALYKAPNLRSIVMTGGHTQDRVQDIPSDIMSRTVTHLNCSVFGFPLNSGSNISLSVPISQI